MDNNFKELLEFLIETFGSSITIILFFIFLYFKYLKNGKVIYIDKEASNGNGKKILENNLIPSHCKIQFLECNSKFDGLTRSNDLHEDKICKIDSKVDEIKYNVAALLERTK